MILDCLYLEIRLRFLPFLDTGVSVQAGTAVVIIQHAEGNTQGLWSMAYPA